ncbi:hypothetical protein MCEMSEM29_01368 [Methylophilaceae bacterium]
MFGKLELMKRIDKTKLQKLIAKLDNGKVVSLRDIELNLGLEWLDRYNSLWNEELERRKYFEIKPKLIKDYDDLIKKADFANNKLQPNTKHPKPTKLYESAIELHKQIVNADIALGQWFDRAFSEATADVEGIARLVTSRSELKRTSGSAEAISKESIKRTVLADAINKIEAEENAFSESDDGKKLKSKLADLLKKSSKWQ